MSDRRRWLRKIVLHLVLVAGCVVFSLPFYWLVTTSMKERTEIFVSPPKWVPSVPRKVVASPYATDAYYDKLKMPDNKPLPIPEADTPPILEELRARGEGTSPALTEPLEALPDGSGLLARGLFVETAAGLPSDQWAGTTPEVTERLAGRVNADLVKKVYRNVFRGLVVREASFEDLSQRSYPLAGSAEVRATSGNATVEPIEEGKGRLLGYDLSSEHQAVYTVEFPMPTMSDGLSAIRVPLTADKSWHSLKIEVDTPEGLYRSAEDFPLADDLTQEVTWRLPASEAGFRREKDYTNLARVGEGTAVAGTARVTLTVTHRAQAAATMRKFTRAYGDSMRYIDFWRYLRNTLTIVILGIAGALFSCSFVAYGFARLEFPGRDVLFGVLLATMMLPGQVTMVPQFLIFRWLGWYNTLLPLWAPSFLGSAFFIFMLRQFMKSIPKDIEDAAKIDGCSYFGIYWRIILPLIKPALAAVAIFTFMGAWNNFMGPLIFLNDERLYPLSLGIYQFRMEHGAEYSMMMAASTIMMLPVLTVFFVAQRHFIQGVTLTGVKG